MLHTARSCGQASSSARVDRARVPVTKTPVLALQAARSARRGVQTSSAVVGLDLEMLAQARDDVGEDARGRRGSCGFAMAGIEPQSRKRAKPATGSRSVTSVFSIAAGSA